MKFYQRKSFKQLQKEWRKILELNDFDDIEYESGALKHSWDRGIGFQNQEAISDFMSELGHMLAHDLTIPERDRAILELHSQGVWNTTICEKLKVSRSTVANTIRKYKRLILSPK